MSLLQTANVTFSLVTILFQIGIVLGVLYLLFFRKVQNSITAFVSKHGLQLAFLVALGSMLGSLFYSNVIGFTPCDLCWMQRICMYPLVLILGIALWKKNYAHVLDYALPLAVIGFLISLYHNYMYYFNQGLNAYCSLGGTSVSCVKRYVFEFGYITIPLMALTSFLLIIILFIFYKLKHGRAD